MLVVKVPAINGLGKTNGCEKAPNAIIQALKEIYSNEQRKEIKTDEIKTREIQINNKNIEETNKNIFNKAREFLEKKENDFVLFLGGDHSISFPLVKAFKSINKNPGLIVFDAHADCMKPMKEPTHEEWIRALVEQGFDVKNIILIALRNLDPEELKFLKEKGINCFFMKELFSDFKETCDLIMESARKFSSLYLSIDIDAIDPAFAPGTSYTEPAGLTSREFVYLLQHLTLLKNLKAADIAEINPNKDINNLTVKLGAKIVAELI